MRGSKLCIVLLSPLLLLALLGPAPSHATDGSNDTTGQIMVELVPGVTIETILDRYNLTLVDSIPEWLTYQVEVNAPDTVELLVPVMEMDLDLAEVEELKLFEIPEGVQETIADLDLGLTPLDFITQPASALVDAGEASVAFQDGAGVVVAVLDTSFDLDNPFLAPRLVARGVDMVDATEDAGFQSNGLDDDGDGLVDEAAHHGTYVAGLILLVAPKSRILPIRVLDEDGRGSAFDVASGLLYAMEQGADVINLSLVLNERSDVIRSAIRRAEESGIVIVVPSGNRGLDEPEFPASMREVISVGSVDATGARSSFSSYGEEIDVVAPGEGLFSLFGVDQFAHWSGTSFAAPWVSGAAALILDRYPKLGPNSVRAALRSTAQPTVDSPGQEGEFGAGMISAEVLAGYYVRDWLTLKLDRAPSDVTVRWSRIPGYQHYAVIRGDLDQIRPVGNTVSLGAVQCLFRASLPDPTGTVVDVDVPIPGHAFFYVIGDSPSIEGYGDASPARRRTVESGDCAP